MYIAAGVCAKMVYQLLTYMISGRSVLSHPRLPTQRRITDELSKLTTVITQTSRPVSSDASSRLTTQVFPQ